MGPKSNAAPYQTIEDLKKELTKRSIPIPSWYKRHTLVTLLQRDISRQDAPNRVATQPQPRQTRRNNSADSRQACALDSSALSLTDPDQTNPGQSGTTQVTDAYSSTGGGATTSDEVLTLQHELAALRETVSNLTRQGEAAPSTGILQGEAPSASTDRQGITGITTTATSTTTTHDNDGCNNNNVLSSSVSFPVDTGFSLQSSMGPPMTAIPVTPRCTSTTTDPNLCCFNVNTDNSHQIQNPHTVSVTGGSCTSGITGNNNVTGDIRNANGNMVIASQTNVCTCITCMKTRLGNHNTMHVPCFKPNLTSHYIPSNLVSPSNGVPSDSLPQIDIVSPSVRRDIIVGKDINLAALLIPGYKSDSTTDRHLVKGSEIIPLKSPGDTRLSRNLLLSEFIMAFTIYKNIMCEAYPTRRQELDNYQRGIVEMAHRFGGTMFYDYHRAFSARAAAMLQGYNVKID